MLGPTWMSVPHLSEELGPAVQCENPLSSAFSRRSLNVCLFVWTSFSFLTFVTQNNVGGSFEGGTSIKRSSQALKPVALFTKACFSNQKSKLSFSLVFYSAPNFPLRRRRELCFRHSLGEKTVNIKVQVMR